MGEFGFLNYGSVNLDEMVIKICRVLVFCGLGFRMGKDLLLKLFVFLGFFSRSWSCGFICREVFICYVVGRFLGGFFGIL